MAKIVIIGAGLTGLSAAYHLEQAGYTDFKIFEKESTIGGLCRSVTQDGFTFDYTGHLLHISDPYFKKLIAELVGFESFNLIQRRSYIYSHHTYTNYPFQTNLFGLPVDVITECITGFINRPKINRPTNFYQWAISNFGTGLTKYFFAPYQTKIFGYDIRKVTASWTGRFVPPTSLQQIITGALSDQTKSIGYNANFYYPKTDGIFSWVYKFAKAIQAPIYTNYTVKQIDLKNKVVLFNNGQSEKFDYLINTMPLDTCLKLIKTKSDLEFANAQNKLICNSVINFNLGINHSNISDKHWIYFPEKQYPFYRLGFYHNFSPLLTPPGCSSIYGEFAYVNKSRAWQDQTLQLALQKTKDLFQIQPDQTLTEKIITIPHAYVIYNFWREQNLPKLLNCLTQNQIYSCGRYGAWKYSSMQEAILDGQTVVTQILKKVEPECRLKPSLPTILTATS